MHLFDPFNDIGQCFVFVVIINVHLQSLELIAFITLTLSSLLQYDTVPA